VKGDIPDGQVRATSGDSLVHDDGVMSYANHDVGCLDYSPSLDTGLETASVFR